MERTDRKQGRTKGWLQGEVGRGKKKEEKCKGKEEMEKSRNDMDDIEGKMHKRSGKIAGEERTEGETSTEMERVGRGEEEGTRWTFFSFKCMLLKQG